MVDGGVTVTVDEDIAASLRATACRLEINAVEYGYGASASVFSFFSADRCLEIAEALEDGRLTIEKKENK